MAFRYLLEAKFEDGFVYKATQEDISVTNPNRNAFFDIKEGLQAEHGRITIYSVQGQEPWEDGKCRRFDIDFTNLPENVKPIWYIKRELDMNISGEIISEVRDMIYGFGYEFINADGKKEKEIIELT